MIPDIHLPFSITETSHNDDEDTDDEQVMELDAVPIVVTHKGRMHLLARI